MCDWEISHVNSPGSGKQGPYIFYSVLAPSPQNGTTCLHSGSFLHSLENAWIIHSPPGLADSSSSARPLWKQPHRHVQRCVSQVTPNSVSRHWRLNTTEVNYWGNSITMVHRVEIMCPFACCNENSGGPPQIMLVELGEIIRQSDWGLFCKITQPAFFQKCQNPENKWIPKTLTAERGLRRPGDQRQWGTGWILNCTNTHVDKLAKCQ